MSLGIDVWWSTALFLLHAKQDCSSEEEEEKDADIFEELITAPNQEDIDELVEGSPAHSSHEGNGIHMYN